MATQYISTTDIVLVNTPGQTRQQRTSNDTNSVTKPDVATTHRGPGDASPVTPTQLSIVILPVYLSGWG